MKNVNQWQFLIKNRSFNKFLILTLGGIYSKLYYLLAKYLEYCLSVTNYNHLISPVKPLDCMVQRSPGNLEALRMWAPNCSLNQQKKPQPKTWKVSRELKKIHSIKKNIYTHRTKKTFY